MLRVAVPETHGAERRYILDVLLGDLLGVAFETHTHSAPATWITDGSGRGLNLPDGLFATHTHDWLTPGSCPAEPLDVWTPPAELGPIDLIEPTLPALYAINAPDRVSDSRIDLGVDVLGACFFMLSRYEEVARPVQDRWGRFPASASLASRAGFLTRPLVHEYAEVLWACLARLWPGLERRRRQGRRLGSCDVDHPLRYRYGPLRVMRHLARDLSASENRLGTIAARFAQVRLGCDARDPFFTFDAIMDGAEARDLTHTFYVFAGHTPRHPDARYRLEDPRMRRLLRGIHARGHTIGLHPSARAWLSQRQISHEFDTLRAVCALEGIHQPSWPARQHHLLLRMPTTLRHLDRAGIDVDASLGFADAAGFRTGACFEHPLFDLALSRRLTLRERPLVAMDCTVMDDRYMGLGSGEQAVDLLRTLEARCVRYGGDFTLLWHNSRLFDPDEKALYERLGALP